MLFVYSFICPQKRWPAIGGFWINQSFLLFDHNFKISSKIEQFGLEVFFTDSVQTYILGKLLAIGSLSGIAFEWNQKPIWAKVYSSHYLARLKAEQNATSVQSSTRPKTEENFARRVKRRSTKPKADEGFLSRASITFISWLVVWVSC